MANDPVSAPEAAAPALPKRPLLIGLAAVGLLVGGASGAVFVGPMVAKKMGKATPVLMAAGAHNPDGEADGGGAAADAEHAPDEGQQQESERAESAAVHLLENLVLNPAGSGGGRFLLLSVAIEVGNAKAGEAFKNRDAELRDIILTALGTKSVDELTEISRRDQYKQELLDAVNARFGKQAVKRLYFPQFVVQ